MLLKKNINLQIKIQNLEQKLLKSEGKLKKLNQMLIVNFDKFPSKLKAVLESKLFMNGSNNSFQNNSFVRLKSVEDAENKYAYFL